jgi:hypothetical protein
MPYAAKYDVRGYPAAVYRRVSAFDSDVKTAFKKHRRRSARAGEWYDLSPKQAVDLLSQTLPSFKIEIEPQIAMKPVHRQYDDWRECRGSYNKYAWRIFVHGEAQSGRLKVSYGALFDTHYLYCATYNWRSLLLVAAFESGTSAKGNGLVERAWHDLMNDKLLGRGSEAEEVGWLSSNATLRAVADFLHSRDLNDFPLSRAKPGDAPLRDPTMSGKFISPGAIPELKWCKV